MLTSTLTTNLNAFNKNNHSVLVFPNPISSKIHLTLPTTNTEIIKFNSFGQIALKEQVSNETEVNLDTSNLFNGLYFIKVGKQIEKFIKE
jgi:hypothetical protein